MYIGDYLGRRAIYARMNERANRLTHLSDCLARYKIPHQVEFLTGLPISAAGKVLWRKLREC